ncbi:hypothetical protein G6F70_008742 [Rhizopus microsporus]|nr:hypothetical protein G6F71_005014 [Rhizopus microsporus]KAG1194776.1 hypothetical protein G6F70_008742 [Rhizopus microsporus]
MFLSPIQLARGLHQGGPISPLLFNLVMEPLVKSIVYSQRTRGFAFPLVDNMKGVSLPGHLSVPPEIKVLTYTDNLLIFLADQHDIQEVQSLIHQYNLASTVRMNYNKNVTFPVPGSSHMEWPTLLQSYGVTEWHDSTPSEPLTYLGYPLLQSYQQRILEKVSKACNTLKQRSLSIRGSATVLNVLNLVELNKFIQVLKSQTPPVRLHRPTIGLKPTFNYIPSLDRPSISLSPLQMKLAFLLGATCFLRPSDLHRIPFSSTKSFEVKNTIFGNFARLPHIKSSAIVALRTLLIHCFCTLTLKPLSVRTVQYWISKFVRKSTTEPRVSFQSIASSLALKVGIPKDGIVTMNIWSSSAVFENHYRREHLSLNSISPAH